MNDASRQAGGKKPPADRLSREQQKKLERVDALLQTRYMADLGPATEGWGRRQLLFLSVLDTGFAGINFFVWPFVHSMKPAAEVAALATTDVDVEAIEPGQSITVVWQGKPIFIRHRTAEEIEAAQNVNLAALSDPQADDARVQNPDWLGVVGVCGHLGCVVRGQRPTNQKGKYSGWFCPCHGSHFDTSGQQTGMIPSLFDDLVEYEDGTDASVDQMAKDVNAWCELPGGRERKAPRA